jgi:hypothetical protein
MRSLPARVAITLLLLSGTASSQDAKHACVTDAYEGQRLRDSGDLAAARALLLKCVAATCPSVVVNDCSTWLAQVEARIPTIVLAARDASGHDLLRVRVRLDDKVLTTALDGTSVAVNPGPHTFLFEGESGAVGEASIIAREGEKDRIVSATLSPPPAPSSAPRAALPVGALIVGGVGVAAIGTFAGFGVWGENARSVLVDGCGKTHACTASEVDAAETKLIVADVSLAVGVVALGSATYLWLVHRRTAEHRSPPVTVAPTAHGITASFSASF